MKLEDFTISEEQLSDFVEELRNDPATLKDVIDGMDREQTTDLLMGAFHLVSKARENANRQNMVIGERLFVLSVHSGNLTNLLSGVNEVRSRNPRAAHTLISNADKLLDEMKSQINSVREDLYAAMKKSDF